MLVMDGYGDETAQSAYIGSGNRLERVWQSEFFDSLGMLYTAVSQHLGFKRLRREPSWRSLPPVGPPTSRNSAELVHLES